MSDRNMVELGWGVARLRTVIDVCGNDKLGKTMILDFMRPGEAGSFSVDGEKEIAALRDFLNERVPGGTALPKTLVIDASGPPDQVGLQLQVNIERLARKAAAWDKAEAACRAAGAFDGVPFFDAVAVKRLVDEAAAWRKAVERAKKIDAEYSDPGAIATACRILQEDLSGGSL